MEKNSSVGLHQPIRNHWQQFVILSALENLSLVALGIVNTPDRQKKQPQSCVHGAIAMQQPERMPTANRSLLQKIFFLDNII
jgi:hypothetical protein